MSKNIDQMSSQSKLYYHQFLTKRVTEQIREEELMKVIKILQTIDQEPALVRQTIKYRFAEKNEELRQQVEVAKEHHTGKFDPKKTKAKKSK